MNLNTSSLLHHVEAHPGVECDHRGVEFNTPGVECHHWGVQFNTLGVECDRRGVEFDTLGVEFDTFHPSLRSDPLLAFRELSS